MTQSTSVKLHAGRRLRFKRCSVPQAKAESLFGKKSAIYRGGKAARRTARAFRRQFGGCCFTSPWHRHSRTPTSICGGSHSCMSRHVHSRRQGLCVYSGNKKWARNVNIGLSDCRRTVAVIDFYKHPFRRAPESQRYRRHAAQTFITEDRQK